MAWGARSLLVCWLLALLFTSGAAQEDGTKAEESEDDVTLAEVLQEFADLRIKVSVAEAKCAGFEAGAIAAMKATLRGGDANVTTDPAVQKLAQAITEKLLGGRTIVNSNASPGSLENPVTLGSRRYVIITEKRDWLGAFSFCGERGMHLLSIESRAELRLLHLYREGTTNSDLKFGENRYWTSGRRFENDAFKWVFSGEKIPVVRGNPSSASSPSVWRQSEPQQPSDQHGQTRDCVSLDLCDSLISCGCASAACDQQYNFICEY